MAARESRWQRRTGRTGSRSIEVLEERRLLSAVAMEVVGASAPAVFVQNQGQWSDPRIRYVYQSEGAAAALTDTGLLFRRSIGSDCAPIAQFSATFLGASATTPVGQVLSGGFCNFAIGDPSLHRSNVPAYQQIVYPNLYPGVDLYLYGQRDMVRYEFHVQPGADYHQIQMAYGGGSGSSVSPDGTLHVYPPVGYNPETGEYHTIAGRPADSTAAIYQQIGGQRHDVEGKFATGGGVAFEVTGQWDPQHELVLASQLEWNAYATDHCSYLPPADGDGNALVAERALFPQTFRDGTTDQYEDVDIVVRKVGPTGEPIWTTYLGGDQRDLPMGTLTTDASGNVYVLGDTTSEGWVAGGYDTSFAGDHLGDPSDDGPEGDAFVAKLSSTGSLLWSTYIGGAGNDDGTSLAVDAAGNVVVCGWTESPDWVSGGYDTSYDGPADGFVVKLSGAGEHLWSSYVGGSGVERAVATVDRWGNVVVGGSTDTGGWVSGGDDTSYNGGAAYRRDLGDVYLMKFSPTGEHLWSTYFGTGRAEGEATISVDRAGNVVIAGVTYPGDPTAPKASYTTGTLLGKFSPSGQCLWSTTLDELYGYSARVALDPWGSVIVMGDKAVRDPSGDWDDSNIAVVKFAANGDVLWSKEIGGSGFDRARDIAVDPWGNLLLAGDTCSDGWVSGGPDTTLGGDSDGYLVKLSPAGEQLWSTYLGGNDGEDPRWRYGDSCWRVVANDWGDVFVVGATSSPGWFSDEYLAYVGMSGPVTAVRNDEFLAVVREAGVRLSPRRIAENAAAGTLVGRLRTSITEGDETFSYSIVDGAGAEDNAGFALVGDKLYSAAVFDHERQESYHVRIRATGDGGTVYEQSFTIEIIDVNETPTDIALAMEDLNRPRPAGTVAGTLSSDDPDEGDSFSYALVDGPGAEDNAKFVVVGNTLRAAADLDRVSGALSVRVRSTDSGGLWNEKVLAISMPALPPQASVVGTPQVTWQNTGQKCYDLTLRLTAFAAPLDLASIDGDELVVSGPAGMVAVSVESVTAAPDGYSAEVTYRLAAPGGRWDQADNGNYSLAVPAGSFADLAGHVNQAGDLGGMGATLRGSTDVQVRGTSTDDVLSVTLTNSEYVVQINGISFVYDASKVRSIVILGYGGNDRITINGESYICEVSAGAGNDTITGGSGDDLIRGDEDQDVIVGNGGEDTLYGNFGNDSITGGDGEDSLMGGLGADTLKGGLMGDSIYGGDQADSVYGDEGDDYIEGRGKADTIYGGAGNDTILGGAGSDAIWAEDGDDLIRVGLSILFADSVDGGAGNDASDGDANDELTNVESVLA